MQATGLRLRPLLFLLVLAVLALLPGCNAGPDPIFVGASREAYSAITPEYLHYVDADAALNAEQKARRHATCDRWNDAIKVRETR